MEKLNKKSNDSKEKTNSYGNMVEYKIYDHDNNVICHDFFSIAGTAAGIRMLVKSTMQTINGKYAEYRNVSARKWKTIANF